MGEETTVFKIVYRQDEYGLLWYSWHNLKKDKWEESKTSFIDKGECLLDFLMKRVNFNLPNQ